VRQRTITNVDGSSDKETCSTNLMMTQAKAIHLFKDQNGKYPEGMQAFAASNSVL
jgi:hypothetical protein